MHRHRYPPHQASYFWQQYLVCAILLILLLFMHNLVLAADLPGSKDHPLLKRFGGSEIVAYEKNRFADYDLQTSTFTNYDLKAKKRIYLAPSLHLEGALTRIWYESPGETSSLELFRNYSNELTRQGFEILYDSTKDNAATSWTGFLNDYGDMTIKTSRSTYVFRAADYGGLKVLSAKKQRAEGDLYVSLTTVEWHKDDHFYKAKRGAYADVEIIEVKPMVENMVTVKADEMAQSMTTTGHIALYGLLFDFNKAEIKEASRATLAEIATLLKTEPNLALYVVGHTDNVGTFAFNLDLSKRRAEAVVAALVKDFGISPKRLTANGVASLAPVATNTTEAGRAKNRRVELVPR